MFHTEHDRCDPGSSWSVATKPLATGHGFSNRYSVEKNGV